ncbi:MAG: VanZ family protein [Bryobacterales bacterium]|nr:VanZ family protein [Bryobacterales bacterium]
MNHRLFRLLLVIGALTLLYGSLHPWEFLSSPRWPALLYRPPYGRSAYLDVLLNILAYVPLGLLAALSFRKWPARIAAFLAVSAMSLAIEYAQLWIRTRDSNLRDFYCNSLGTFLGVLAGPWLAKRLRIASVAKVFQRDPAAWSLLLAWIFWQTFPFLPHLRFIKLTALLTLWRAPRFSFLETGDSLCTGMVLALLAASARAPWAWLVLIATLLLRSLIIGHSLPLPVFLGAIAGFALTRRFQPKASLAAPLLLTWILLRELYPFSFAPAAATFHWGLFAAILEAERITVIRTLLGKFFLYTSALWLLKESGWRTVPAATLLSVALLVCEWLQRYLPGRTPELTDVILAIAGAALLTVLTRQRRARNS